jgi:N-methylhydantoinase B
MLTDATVTILSDRRKMRPYGIAGGGKGKEGRSILIRDGEEVELGGKQTIQAKKGDRIRIETPGGGGYGKD